MNYENVCDLNFLNKFGVYRSKVSSIILLNKYEIDVFAIADACDISIEYSSSEHSGWSINQDNLKRKIVINKFEPEYRQRFAIAHEISHIILNHQNRLHQNKSEEYSDTISRIYNFAANKFASQMIMPEKLVKQALQDSIDTLGYSIELNFSEREITKIINFSASLLNVSTQALFNRVDDLGLFIDN